MTFDSSLTASAEPSKILACTEVWGGFQTVDRELHMPGLDGRVYSRPFQGRSGGDVHYVSSCGSGVFSRLLLADVSGHGGDVAKTAARLQQLMRRHIASHTQSGLVRAINRSFAAEANNGTFATAVVMTYDSQRRRLVFCNAGHPPPLIYRAATRDWSYLGRSARDEAPADGSEQSEPADLPLGVMNSTEYNELQFTLERGDLIVCYTDWLIEARKASGEMLGFDRLLAVARSLPIESPGRMTRALLSAVTRWSGAELGDDDVTLLLFRATGRRSRPRLATYLLAPGRILRTLAASCRTEPRESGEPREPSETNA